MNSYVEISGGVAMEDEGGGVLVELVAVVAMLVNECDARASSSVWGRGANVSTKAQRKEHSHIEKRRAIQRLDANPGEEEEGRLTFGRPRGERQLSHDGHVAVLVHSARRVSSALGSERVTAAVGEGQQLGREWRRLQSGGNAAYTAK